MCDFTIQQNRCDTLNTYSKEHSPPWEANRFSANQETPLILWNPNVHYRIHESPSHDPILSQIDLVHAPTSHFLKIHLNIILPSTPMCSKWSLPQVSPPPLLPPIRATCHALNITKTLLFCIAWSSTCSEVNGSVTVQGLSNSKSSQNLFFNLITICVW